MNNFSHTQHLTIALIEGNAIDLMLKDKTYSMPEQNWQSKTFFSESLKQYKIYLVDTINENLKSLNQDECVKPDNISLEKAYDRLQQMKKPMSTAKANIVEPSGIKVSNETLIKQLQKYIARIETYKKNGSEEIDFQKDFFLFKQSRGLSRQMNYELAKKLVKDLETQAPGSESESLVDKTKRLRTELIESKKSDPLFAKDFVDRGIQSTELNDIIRKNGA